MGYIAAGLFAVLLAYSVAMTMIAYRFWVVYKQCYKGIQTIHSTLMLNSRAQALLKANQLRQELH